ncbi:hypothetical protein BXT84_09415 [Sulfobacillus thermotolerans]|uniref:HTH luxR-type domain-containing protein n=1 Tax=Sulfobacillus thermotolerans TaxID=338644 RepID=A0ABM6RS29_9FIRM|nr:hypothetical protein BXT84_09415 [Sulfobacillus thermotolerans]
MPMTLWAPRQFVAVARYILPILCLAEILTGLRNVQPAFVIGGAAALDVTLCCTSYASKQWQCTASWRDCLYAIGFYVVYLTNSHVPAMLLAAIPVMELSYMGTKTLVHKVFGVSVGLVGVRIWTLHRMVGWFPHPAWPLFIVLVVAMAAVLGRMLRYVALPEDLMRSRQRDVRAAVATLIHEMVVHGVGEPWRNSSLEELLAQMPERFEPGQCAGLAQALANVLQGAGTVVRPLLLTPREHEVIRLMADGHPYRVIAHMLKISEGTARAHAASILRKAGAHSREEALQWAHQHHLLP